MTSEELIERRLFNQKLNMSSLTDPADLVSWLGAIQSQDFSGGLWAISQRLDFLSKDEIEKSFNNGNFLRIHVMRPTWHFVTAQDIGWMLELTRDRVKRFMSTYNKMLGLDDEIFEKSEQIIKNELKNNNYLTRNELGELLKKNNIHWEGNGLAHIVMMAELNAVICSGPKKDKQQTYALVLERAPHSVTLPREDALKELARRYFQSHGPAQLSDYVWWSGLLTTDAKKGIELNQNIKHESVDGKTYFYFDTQFQRSSKNVFLLPNYDEYTVAYKDREVLIKNVDKTKLDFRQNSLFNNVVLINGRIEGVWRRTLKTKKVLVETRLFRIITELQKKELSQAFLEYANFLNLPLELT